MGDQVTLYVDGYFVSPLDATCLVALEEKGVPYTTSRSLLRDNQGFPAQFQQRTGVARVPALQHGDFWLTESMAIAEYIDDTFRGPPLLPAEARAKARARQIMAFVRFELRTLRAERPWWTTIYPADAAQLAPLGMQALQETVELLNLVDWLAARGALADWCIAHVDLALTLMRLAKTQVALPAAAQRLLDANLVRPSVRAYLEHPRPPNPPPFR